MKKHSRGIFIAVDGIDGAGKTTLVSRLAEILSPLKPITTKEPTSESQWGQKLRATAIEGRLPRDQELEYFCKDREHHIKRKILPALEKGKIVISDRYVDSTLAFQAHSPMEANALYKKLQSRILIPDVTFILDCPVNIGLERIRARNGKGNGQLSKFETVEFLERARAIYASRKGINYEIVDASHSFEETFRQVIVAMRKRFSNKKDFLQFFRPSVEILNGGYEPNLILSQ